jgi:hypothetical protein
MRAAARSFLLLVLIAFAAAEADAQPGPGGGVNQLSFQAGSPSPTVGGVDVAVTQKATTGQKCIKMVIRVIDNASGMLLDSHAINDPPESVMKSFAGLGNNRQVQVSVTATFKVKGDDAVEAKSISAVVTTR